MKVKNLNLNLELGQEIIVGPNKEKATITKIEYHEKSGDISINTTKGPRKALTFKLCTHADNTGSAGDCIADKYR